VSDQTAIKIKTALISVSDKSDLDQLAATLRSHDIAIVSTGGTSAYLKEQNFKVTEVSAITGFPEMMDGRVKTLHPLIYAGLLNRPVIDDKLLEKYSITNIDLVVVNLYPFEETIAQHHSDAEKAVENIDIGGPSMIRATAKNYHSKTILTDPSDYETLITELANNQGCVTYTLRKQLALKAFGYTACYDAAIWDYFSKNQDDTLPQKLPIGLTKKTNLRYGENPHQRAAIYQQKEVGPNTLVGSKLHQGKELSYNNLLDANAAIGCVQSFNEPACVIVKHVNPCGVAIGSDLDEAYKKSFHTDPESAFGGVIAVNRNVDGKLIKNIINNQFLELLIAPSFDSDALKALEEKQNIRVIEMDGGEKNTVDYSVQTIDGGFLIQEGDAKTIDRQDIDIVTLRQPEDEEIKDMLFAWKVVKYVKSNAIVFARQQQTIGIGAGQMSRVMSAKIASLKAASANLHTKNCVMASDGFFPFRDSIEMAAEYGISCVIQPGGSIRDDEVIAAADEHNLVMGFTGIRHFKH
jgi:phosphoribosylaminoimidazolecarboxamide formyltransferase/IMP cyclohydrolase